MAYDLEEQEQIAQLKAFWQQWGKLIVGIVLVGVRKVWAVLIHR